MNSLTTKQRSIAIAGAARRLLDAHQIDMTGQVELTPLARKLAEETGCRAETAKRHLATAVRQRRGELVRAGRPVGRPPLGDEPMEAHTIYVSAAQWHKVQERGGAAYIRRLIDAEP